MRFTITTEGFGIPSGATGLQRIVSFTIAVTQGKDASSVKSGSFPGSGDELKEKNDQPANNVPAIDLMTSSCLSMSILESSFARLSEQKDDFAIPFS